MPNQVDQFMCGHCLLDAKKHTISFIHMWSRLKTFCFSNAVVMIDAPISDAAPCSGAEQFGQDLAFSNIDIDSRRVTVPDINQNLSNKTI